jgi:hypothetical protein
MRTLFAASLALLLALGIAPTAWGQAPAHAKIQGLWGAQVKAAEKTSAARNMEPIAEQFQYQQPVQQSVLVATPEELASGVQMAGYPAAATGVFGGNCPDGSCAPGGYGYGHHGYPGGPFQGGHYGHFGGAHRTPGYPHHHLHREYVGPQGPPTAQVAYPYYTIRGPRDFFLDNPPSIGR